ncbi:hypothetical protein V6Z12_A11G131300 [Gossypium hirsutum]
MATLWSVMVLMACFSSLALSSSQIHAVQYSSISAAPAFLPAAPLSSSPGLPPDIEPLLPTPKASTAVSLASAGVLNSTLFFGLLVALCLLQQLSGV